MITHLGSVVYDRKPHPFTEKAVARILTRQLEDMGPKAAAEFLTNALDPFYRRFRGYPWVFATFMKHMILGWMEAQVYTLEFLKLLLEFV